MRIHCFRSAFRFFESLASESHEIAEQMSKEAMTFPMKIGLLRDGSGAFITGENILEAAFNLQALHIKTYNNTKAMLDDIEAGKIDTGIFVEYPGRVQGKFQGSLEDTL